MKISKAEQNTDEWFAERRGKITGSKLKDILVKRGNKRKVGFYQLIADRVAVIPDDEDVMERGHRLEDEAIKLFEADQGVSVERVGLVVSDHNANIAVSPDGLIKAKGKYTEAVEVKCLSSARHLEAIITGDIPNDYIAQAQQYFIVMPELQVLHMVFYDPRIPAKPYYKLSITSDYWAEGELEKVEQYQLDALAEVDKWVEQLTF